jgi:hypothetical protein
MHKILLCCSIISFSVFSQNVQSFAIKTDSTLSQNTISLSSDSVTGKKSTEPETLIVNEPNSDAHLKHGRPESYAAKKNGHSDRNFFDKTALTFKENGTDFNLIEPIPFDTNGIGAVQIKVYPENAVLFLNGELIGKGNHYIKNLKSGVYNALVSYKDDQKTEHLLIRSGELLCKEFELGRSTHFILEPKFSTIWVHGLRCFGPSLDMGLLYKKHYYGINYHWDFGSPDNQSGNLNAFGGAALQYSYYLRVADYLIVAPGACVGFWYADGWKDNRNNESYYYSSSDEYFEEFYFSGATLTAKFGSKYVYGVLSYTLLIGSAFGNALQFGISVEM